MEKERKYLNILVTSEVVDGSDYVGSNRKIIGDNELEKQACGREGDT
jgi:hypothetical protein